MIGPIPMLTFDRLHAQRIGPTDRAAQVRLMGCPVHAAVADPAYQDGSVSDVKCDPKVQRLIAD
jgi:hypothetical protein